MDYLCLCYLYCSSHSPQFKTGYLLYYYILSKASTPYKYTSILSLLFYPIPAPPETFIGHGPLQRELFLPLIRNKQELFPQFLLVLHKFRNYSDYRSSNSTICKKSLRFSFVGFSNTSPQVSSTSIMPSFKNTTLVAKFLMALI